MIRQHWQENLFNESLTGICFIRKRVSFLRPDGSKAKSNPYGSMLYLYNGSWSAFARHFAKLGTCIEPGKIIQHQPVEEIEESGKIFTFEETPTQETSPNLIQRDPETIEAEVTKVA